MSPTRPWPRLSVSPCLMSWCPGSTACDLFVNLSSKGACAQLELHGPTVERMRESYAKRGMELNEARLRMATLPAPSEVLFSEGTWWVVFTSGVKG
eukprot:1159109-Pelagomonas_calceolata.AAC.9